MRTHFYDALIKDSAGEGIFKQHIDSIENIGTPYPNFRHYLTTLEDSDVLLARTFMSVFTEKRGNST
jgi:hypothetical protein